MKNSKNIVIMMYFGLILFACKDTANTTIKEDNRVEMIEDRTPVLKEEWKENMNDWSEGEGRSTLKATISNNTDFDSFVKALKSANMYIGLDELEEATIFIPTNVAFDELRDSYLAELKTPNKEKQMTEILNYHIVPEEYDKSTLLSTIRLNEGVLRLKTLQGGYLAMNVQNNQLVITDEMGHVSKVSIADIEASNGVIHEVDHILMPQ